MEAGPSGVVGTDRMAQLAALRKSFAAHLKTARTSESGGSGPNEQLLEQFSRVCSHFTPEELCAQFKEHLLFCSQIAEELVQQIRRRANSENTREAALAVYTFLRAEPDDSRGWMLLKAIIFLTNSGSAKIFECLCKTLLPNTLVKVAYLFMDLPDAEYPEEQAHRRRLYDSLVMLIMNLCSQPQVAEELIQKDDLFLLFIGASSRSPSPDNIWRNANFTFLCSLVAKALTAPVLKYINSKRCIAHYVSNIGTVEEEEERTVLLCNLLDLLRSSAESTQKLIEDFGTANGFQMTLDACLHGSLKNAEQILAALANLITAGGQTVQFQIPQQNVTSHFHAQKMIQSIARSTGTVRSMGAYKVLERCFTESEDEQLCLLVLQKIGQLFRAERINYFIVDESSSLFLITEAMMTKSVEVQEKVLELVENVLRVLNYVPYKEIASLNLHLKNSVSLCSSPSLDNQLPFEQMERLLHFFLKIISINATLRDAFRELLVLDTFLHIVHTFSTGAADSTNCFTQPHIRRVVQLCMDLLMNATKGNVLNAQFITENIDVKIVKALMLAPRPKEGDEDELKTSMAHLVKQLLYLAKNEQLFSSILQLLFAEPENVELCSVIMKLFNTVLLESHKVRMMFRRSGGYICLMTLLLHLENALNPSALCSQLSDQAATLAYIALLFKVLSVSMRFEPSNAKYFQSEVRPSMINSILRNLGCFGQCNSQQQRVHAHHPIWAKITMENCESKLRAIHACFSAGIGILDGKSRPKDVPPETSYALFILRLLLDLAIDNFAKPSNELHWAEPEEWLQNVENLETVPLLTWQSTTVLAHPTPILAILQLFPSIGGANVGGPPSVELEQSLEMDSKGGREYSVLIPFLDEWAATAQLYMALVLKAILRVERNQQTMCQFDMPAMVLELGEQLFKMEGHPLLSSFHYFYERLAYQSLHAAELRHFLRMDKPLCSTNLDDGEEAGGEEQGQNGLLKSGGPIPIHRIKAFVSMLTPRNHAFVHSPAFVELDMAIEGFASLLIPSLSHGTRSNGQLGAAAAGGGGGGNSLPVGTDPGGNAFTPSAGFTLAIWLNISEFMAAAQKCVSSSSPSCPSICLFSIVRAYEDSPNEGTTKANAMPSTFYGHQLAANIENHQTCFQVHLQRLDCCWSLVISGAEHSVADELRKDFKRAPEQCMHVPISEQYLPPKQWAHLAIVVSRPPLLLKSSAGPCQVEVFINGRSLAAQKLAFPWTGGQQQPQAGESTAFSQRQQQPTLHAFVGTLPFLRRAQQQFKWRLASVLLLEEAITAETIRKIVALGAAYQGNLQTSTNADGTIGPPLVAEKRIVLSLNAAASAESSAQALRPMMGSRTDLELVTALLGISPNDTSCPLRLLWNMASSAGSGRSLPLGAVLIGYLGIRTFAPCPVSALLDPIGGLLPLFGLVAMSSCSSGLYASLKVLVSALHTNDSIPAEMHRQRGFQTLAILLEEKVHLMNSHILHLVLTLSGTVDDGSREQVGIPSLQTFEDLLCDLDVWREAPEDVWKLLLEHFFELLVETADSDNLARIRQSQLLGRLFIYLTEQRTLFPVRNDIPFRLIAAILQPPCDGQSLLRLGQTISATVAFDMDETAFPLHIAELERALLEQGRSEKKPSMEGNGEGVGEEVRDAQMYAVYVRNRLLNIIGTMLAHSNAQVNSQLSAQIVDTLGFGWILALCGPRVHQGTLLMAMRILTNLLRFPQLVEKFRDGSANGGWLSDADSVIRNRAAVLLGFSVANQVGAVGAHVDINPELDKCSGFASLEHVAYAHADKPFCYLALLAILFQQPKATIQALDDFSVEVIWSSVFGLGAQSSVAEAIERCQFCADAIISLLATIRAALHKQLEEPGHSPEWAVNYPLRLLQLFTFLYQNSAQFFAICHTEAFAVALFSALLPSASVGSTPQSPSARGEGQEEEEGKGKECGASAASHDRCVRQCLELLTNILLNDLCLANETRSEPLFDAIIEFLDAHGNSRQSQQLFTELVNACLDHFMASKMFFATTPNAAPLIVPPNARSRLNQSSETTSSHVVRFLSRVIDTVWNCTYKGNPIRILKCFLKLLAEAHASNKAAAQLQCTDAHIASLFRLILYLLSRPIDNVDTQMCVLDTLAEIVRNQHLFLTPKSSIDPLFYAALVHLVFMLSDRPQFDLQDPRNRQLERGTAQVTICAQSVWGILWQHKKGTLEEWFRRGELDLDLFTARAKCASEANRAWLQFVDSQTDGSYSQQHPYQHQDSSGSGRLSAAQKMLPQQLQFGKLGKAARSGLQRLRKSTNEAPAVDPQQSTKWLSALLSFEDERLRVEPETFYMWIRVHISLVRELIRSQCQRYHEWHAHVRKWCMEEWHNSEAELTRQRGLWGPERGSCLDKFQLDVTEGPCRIRRKLVPNPGFYQLYPYRPHLDAPEAKPLRAKVAISFESKAYFERMRAKRAATMDEQAIVDWQIGSPQQQLEAVQSGQQQQQPVEASAELNMSMIKRMVQKNLEQNEKEEDTKSSERAIEEEEEEELVDEEEEEENVGEEVADAEEESGQLEEEPKWPKPMEVEKEQKPNDEATPNAKVIKKSQSDGKEVLGQGPDNQTLLRLLERGEQLHSMFRCARVQGLDTMEGLLLFGKDHFYVVDGFTLLKTREIRDLDFLPEQFHDPIIPYIAMGCRSRPQSSRANRQCNKFAYEDVKEVHKRRYLLQQIALEVFSADGRNFLLAFPRKVRDRVYQKLVSMAKRSSSGDLSQFMQEQKKQLLRPAGDSAGPLMSAAGGMMVGSQQLISNLFTSGAHQQAQQQQSMSQKWLRGELSNFHYLMALNTMAGRSYNDLSQYPVFPWILADYESEQLDLTDPKTFRDLGKPMGAQSPDRLHQFLKRFREWDDPGGTPPYMYGTHYSSAMIVLSYLVRLEPFTQQFLKLQGGHFDLADRMFHSIRDAFWSAAKNNMADVKELIPEFFYLPELLLNSNRFDLGLKQSGVRVDHVLLPAWAHGDPVEFVRLHRQALECDFVSEHLHEWIDLVFGYKQTGEPAREAHNVFHHLFYETSVDIETIEDPLQRNATLGFINNFGQIPAQLFKKPHPQRKVLAQANVGTGTSAGQGTSMVQVLPGLHTARLFYHHPEQLRVSPRPVKELRAAVGEIVVNERANQVVVLEENKVFIPPAAFLAWGFHDRSIRFGQVGLDKSACLLETNDVYEITCMATTDGRQVFAGLSTGPINVWALSGVHSPSNAKNLARPPRLVPKGPLVGHSDVITALVASAAHNVLLSGSRDRTVILWHLTRLSFIRQLPGPHPGTVTAMAINEAKGDIATASGPWLFLWTINGVPLATVNTLQDNGLFTNASSLILCIAFSTANDWDENNLVLCGTTDGLLKLYSCERRNQQADGDEMTSINNNAELFRQTAAEGQQRPSVKEHLLKRQQRIQQHHSHHYSSLAKIGSAQKSFASSETASIASEASSSPLHQQPGDFSPFSSSNCGRQESALQQQHKTPTNRPSPQQVVPPEMASIQWTRALRLRRILSEHTAFTAGNEQPAPITAIQPTKDHRSVLVGDGVGRIWMWTTTGEPSEQ